MSDSINVDEAPSEDVLDPKSEHEANQEVIYHELAHAKLNELGVGSAVRELIESSPEKFADATLEILPSVKIPNKYKGTPKISGPRMVIRFQKEKVNNGIIVSKGIMVERVGDELEVSYLAASSRPKDFPDLTEKEKAEIELKGVEPGGWRRLVSEKRELYEDQLSHWLGVAGKSSERYYDNRQNGQPDKHAKEFKYSKHEDGSYWMEYQ